MPHADDDRPAPGQACDAASEDALGAGEADQEDEGWPAAGDPVVERWLRDEVVPALIAVRAHPDSVISADQMRAELDAVYAEALRTGACGTA